MQRIGEKVIRYSIHKVIFEQVILNAKYLIKPKIFI